MSKRSNQLRIIGGRWRGRKLTFPDSEGLRPTPDRVRETLFNWLQADIGGAYCLDLFAGSGALGLEAASRGAEQVVLVETNHQVVKQLKDNIQLLGANNCIVEMTAAQQFIKRTAQSRQYDIVFIDPPYQANLWSEVAEQLVNSSLIVDNGLIYLEYPSKGAVAELPQHWCVLKDKQAGEVRYCLLQNKIGDSV